MTDNSGKKDKLTSPGDFAFGDLNAMFKSVIRPFYEYGDDTATLIKKTLVDSLLPDHILNSGPYKGIVLRVEKNLQGGTPADPGSKNAGRGNANPELVQIKVRIPEMHAAIPVPSAFGDVGGPHQAIIDMFHTFTAQSDHVPEPDVGELVWVDFVDKFSMSGGIYIRPVAEREKIVNLIKEQTGTNAFGACGQYNAGSTSGGDGIPTGNTPIARAGLPQTKRSKTPTGRNIIIEGGGVPGRQQPYAHFLALADQVGGYGLN